MVPEYFIGIGEGKVIKDEGILKVVGVGSCVVVILLDKENKIGGLSHSMLPAPKNPAESSPPFRYVSTAIPRLLKEMESLGSIRQKISAYIIGGATIFESPVSMSPWSIGTRNILEARGILSRLGIPVIKEEVGGNEGRTVIFDVGKPEIRVKKRDKEIVFS